MKKVLLSSLIATVITAWFAITYAVSGSKRVTATVLLYYVLWLSVYGVLDWAEDKIKGWRKHGRRSK